jgi:invasion protein IalB
VGFLLFTIDATEENATDDEKWGSNCQNNQRNVEICWLGTQYTQEQGIVMHLVVAFKVTKEVKK